MVITGTATVRFVEPVIPPKLAETVVVPDATAVKLPPALTVATCGACEVHFAVFVTSPVVASVYVAVATSCCVAPTTNDGFCGVTAIEASGGATERFVLAAVEP
jgi:hypothetical protein